MTCENLKQGQKRYININTINIKLKVTRTIFYNLRRHARQIKLSEDLFHK